MFYSTQDKNKKVSLEEAIMRGLSEDGGLFMPEHINKMPKSFFEGIDRLSFQEIAFEVAKVFLEGAMDDKDLKGIVEKAITFDAPLKKLTSQIYVLELFHGPTLSFKDFGASFMAQMMQYFVQKRNKVLHILVATSGDTGSAIGHSFLHIPNVYVWILYPKGKVSLIQEKQLTTLGSNVQAIEVDGVFDDCQRLVKQCFSDPLLRKKLLLTSANSINIARLIPQTFYYFNAFARLKKSPLIFSVPSGNFGNLTAGLIAKRMGLPISRFIAATNVNDSVPRYLETGVFTPKASIHTLSNAMDVGNPSNFKRMLDLYGGDRAKMAEDILGSSFTDDQTKKAIQEVLKETGYLLDPHGAVAYLGLKTYLKNETGIFLETAHPAKFKDPIETITGQKIEIPKRLQEVALKEKQAIPLRADYELLRDLLEKK